ncbi:hypothetical protein BHE74_00007168 [Ensete ventricosum]|nr:hypothetical protein BHE74_00007168 [Ensete ventricosum]
MRSRRQRVACGRDRFFSRTRRQSVSPRGETDRGDGPVRVSTICRYTGYQYADRSLPGGTAKIDRRRSISTVGDRLEEIDRWRSIEGEKGKKKKKRKRRKKKEEEKKKEYLALFLPARCRRLRATAALARGSLASRRDPRSRFFSRTRRKIEATSPLFFFF